MFKKRSYWLNAARAFGAGVAQPGWSVRLIIERSRARIPSPARITFIWTGTTTIEIKEMGKYDSPSSPEAENIEKNIELFFANLCGAFGGIWTLLKRSLQASPYSACFRSPPPQPPILTRLYYEGRGIIISIDSIYTVLGPWYSHN